MLHVVIYKNILLKNEKNPSSHIKTISFELTKIKTTEPNSIKFLCD